jgi:hypothetical protein
MSFAGKLMDHHVKQNKSDSERQVLHVFAYIWKLKKKSMRKAGGPFEKRKGTRARERRNKYR